ncbi:MAG TPA: hypothetical protein VFR35_08230 [Actinoplanes sp.]|nr:hypothetical protein [Actinoplanes sp.]
MTDRTERCAAGKARQGEHDAEGSVMIDRTERRAAEPHGKESMMQETLP